MNYYFSKELQSDFPHAVDHVAQVLQQEGFGIVSEIDVKNTLEKKLGVGFRRYRILGARNPSMAHQALLLEDKIGTMLPCNVVVQELPEGGVEVAAIDPVASMAAVDNPQLRQLAGRVRDMLQHVIASL
jgi:uncharacterized protein (DUF302 family)